MPRRNSWTYLDLLKAQRLQSKGKGLTLERTVDNGSDRLGIRSLSRFRFQLDSERPGFVSVKFRSATHEKHVRANCKPEVGKERFRSLKSDPDLVRR